LTTTVNNIEHLESNTFNGIGVIKVYLQPGANVDAAIAETTAACQAILKALMDYGYATSKRAKFTHIKDKENEYNSCVIERAQKLWV
jgi:hypothetical protein